MPWPSHHSSTASNTERLGRCGLLMMPQQVEILHFSRHSGTTSLNLALNMATTQILQKTWLVVSKASEAATGLSITKEGRKHLGVAFGARSFIESYVQHKVSRWVQEVKCLSFIAANQLHAAYAPFTHGLTKKWIYLAKTTPNLEECNKKTISAISHRPKLL